MKGSFGREIGTALVDELAIVIGALVGGAAAVGAGMPTGGAQWVAEIAVSGSADGACVIAFDEAAAGALTARVMGLEGPAPPDAVIDTFTEVCNQAIVALSVKPVARGATLTLTGMRQAAALEPGAEWAVHAIAGDALPAAVTVTTWGEIRAEAPATGDETPGTTPGRAAAVPAGLRTEGTVGGDLSQERLDVILDLDLPLTVRFGHTELPLKVLTQIGPGSLIDLGRSPDDPVDILVSHRVIARGEVVIVNGNYGVRIVDVVSQRERVRTLES